MKYLFYIDTGSKNSLILLMNENEIVGSRSNEEQSSHGQLIHLYLEELLTEASLTWKDIKGICVLNGPGSYTGLRISLSVAKGICYALEIPLILLNKLDMLYECAKPSSKNSEIYAVIKAREDEYFVSLYPQIEDGTPKYLLLNKETLVDNVNLKHALLCIEANTCEMDFNDFLIVELQSSVIQRICFTCFYEMKYADLFLSEPFYMKKVHINKINKL